MTAPSSQKRSADDAGLSKHVVTKISKSDLTKNPERGSLEHLIVLAREQAHERAFAFISGVRVGSACLAESGAIYVGCNVESGCDKLGTCAERNAIWSGVAAEGKSFRIKRIVCIFHDDCATKIPCPRSPCGGCRAVINDWQGKDCQVYFEESTDHWI